MSRRNLVFLGVLAAALLAAIAVAFLPDRDTTDTDNNSPGITPATTLTPSIRDDDSDVARESPAPGSPITTPGRANFVSWEGNDDAVSSWLSEKCGREVLQFGSQQYAPGESTSSVPPEVEFMGYRNKGKELWGDRGAPNTLYVTEDEGKTFASYEATDSDC